MPKAFVTNKQLLFPTILLVMIGLAATACTAASASVVNSAINPIIVMNAPLNNVQFREGDQVTVQSTSTDLSGIVRVELSVDNNIVRTDPLQNSQTTAIMVQTWTATVGTHTLTVRAVNTSDVSSAPASIAVSVVSVVAATQTPRVVTATPIPPVQIVTAAPVPSTCVNNSVFVADVTIPDKTVLQPGQTFVKTWRVRNTGTCTWGSDEELVFVRGEQMAKTATFPIPSTAPGATVELSIAMTASAAPGNHIADWRMRNRGGAIFGTTLNVAINVPGPTPINTPVNCPFTPAIESFTASATTITAGQSATLNWGAVIGAEMAEIDNDIGGVSTPGSIAVNPATTTTYTLTATCGDKSRTAQVTISVNAAAPPAAPTATTAPTNTPTRTPTATPKP
ncbi:MAG TPA: NBR1-Ig-like domain-containing protein [Anaerolineae bacterium]